MEPNQITTTDLAKESKEFMAIKKAKIGSFKTKDEKIVYLLGYLKYWHWSAINWRASAIRERQGVLQNG